MDATFYEHYMSDRGLMQGLEYRYVADQESKGAFLADVLDDKNEKDLSDPEELEVSPFPPGPMMPVTGSGENQTRLFPWA